MREHRGRVGGMWKEMGELQYKFMLSVGMKPEHKLLDVGCGCLRAGVHFIKYLNSGNYYGMDKDLTLLRAGKMEEIPAYGLQDKKIWTARRQDFYFQIFDTKFDFAIAQSVFTHIHWNNILRCLYNMSRMLKPGGKFYASFFEDKDGTHMASGIEGRPFHKSAPKPPPKTFPHKDPFHYTMPDFEYLAKRTGLTAKYVGEWGHPRDQMMVVFTK